MCGISGIISVSGRPVRDAGRRVARMNALMHHRGPDYQGVYVSGDGLVALGNARLSIVDVANEFDVPMVSTDGQTVLSFNGEIYNYRDERRRLMAAGVSMRTHSDTEVLLEGLRLEGDAFLTKLDGFWAYAFYDARRHRLSLGRDLMGERHIFYWMDGDELVFASEANAVLDAAAGPFRFDVDGVVSAFRFRASPPGRTLIEGLKRLEAGCLLALTPGRRDVAISRAVRLNPESWFEFFHRGPSEAQVIAAYEEALYESGLRRVPSEVEFMATLSGGLDSALVNVYASDLGRRPVNTLYGRSTVEPPRKGSDTLDELAASRVTSSRLHTRHHVFDMIGDDCVPLYRDQASSSFDGTFCEALVNFEQLAQQVHGIGGRVLLVSDGPDDLIGGYDVDISAYRLHQDYKNRPMAAWALRALARNAESRNLLPAGRRNALLNWSYFRDWPFRFRVVHGGTSPDVLRTLFGAKLERDSRWHYGTIPADYQDLAQQLDVSQRMALAYAATSLPDHFNLRIDRGAMRYSVESRLPLQAPALVNLMIATPQEWRFQTGNWTKYIFRKLVEKHVGPDIAYRNKYGFAYQAGRIPRLARMLDFESVIAGSDIFAELPFEKGAREYLLAEDTGRHRFMAYSLALVSERLKARDFSIGPVPKVPLRQAAVAATGTA
jgi:asparagine synthase (glutamine-hydrolysing)